MPRPSITEERRLQIIEAAGAVIAERGVCDTRISDVADRIGTSTSLILYYFPSKDALLVEAIAHQDRQFFDAVASATRGVASAEQRLRILIDESVPPPATLEREDNEWLLWLDMWTRSRHDARLAAERQRMDDMLRRLISGIVEDGISAGEFRPVDAEEFAIHLAALIDGLAIQVLLRDPAVSAARMRTLCLDLIVRELRPTAAATR